MEEEKKKSRNERGNFSKERDEMPLDAGLVQYMKDH
jgi:hypothetical protein